jgi:hypothetical protein
MNAANTPLSEAEAKHYLELIHTLPSQCLGPHRFYENVADADRQLAPLAARLVTSVQKSDARTFLAPSPWHAAAWLMEVAVLAGQMANRDDSSGLQSPYDPKYGPPVFRGQSGSPRIGQLIKLGSSFGKDEYR